MGESRYQTQLVKKLRKLLPDCLILRSDPSYIQGIPDLMILYNDKWAGLEVKRSRDAALRPNQLYYIDLMRKMSFAACIYPENEQEVLNDLQHALRFGREARVFKS